MSSLRAVAADVAELAVLESAWRRFPLRRIDADPDFFRALVQASPHVIRPHVAVLGESSSPVALLVARVEDARLSVSVGYRAIYKPRVRQLTVAHGGLATNGSGVGWQLLIDETRRVLAAGDCDVALLPALRIGSSIHSEARRVGWLGRGHGHRPAVHRRLVLPSRFDDFLTSLRNRKRIQAYRRRLERDFGERLEVRVYRSSADLEQVLRDLTHVSRKTYQHGLGVAFDDSELRRQLTRVGLGQGWFRAWVMYIDGEPVSFWPGDTCSRAFYTGTPGYDPAFASYRVGMLLLLRVIEDLCEDPDVDAIDFNFGDADYKRRFSNEGWEEEDVLLFAPTFRGIRINLTYSALLSATALGRHAAAKVGLDRVVKRWWRDRLASQESKP